MSRLPSERLAWCELSERTMSKRAFDKIKAGLDSAKAYLDGTADKRKYRVHAPETVDVRKIDTSNPGRPQH